MNSAVLVGSWKKAALFFLLSLKPSYPKAHISPCVCPCCSPGIHSARCSAPHSWSWNGRLLEWLSRSGSLSGAPALPVGRIWAVLPDQCLCNCCACSRLFSRSGLLCWVRRMTQICPWLNKLWNKLPKELSLIGVIMLLYTRMSASPWSKERSKPERWERKSDCFSLPFLKRVNVSLPWRRSGFGSCKNSTSWGKEQKLLGAGKEESRAGRGGAQQGGGVGGSGSLPAELSGASGTRGCAGRLCLRCLGVQPGGLNWLLESRTGQPCVCPVVTFHLASGGGSDIWHLAEGEMMWPACFSTRSFIILGSYHQSSWNWYLWVF